MSTASASQGSSTISAALSGTFRIGGDLTVHRLGFGAMRITGDGVAYGMYVWVYPTLYPIVCVTY